MTKPFHVKVLLVRMNNLLEQRKKICKRFSQEIVILSEEVTVTSMDERFLQKALSILEENIGDSEFSVEKFSDEIGMSRKNLHRKLIALTDQAPGDLTRNFRLKRAADILDAKSGNISETFQVGFNNLSYFSKCFKDLFGLLPQLIPS